MARYEVTVMRTAHRTATIEVEASSVEDAEEKALEEAYNVEFAGEKEAEYEVLVVDPLEEA